jgi:hypothetical protein
MTVDKMSYFDCEFVMISTSLVSDTTYIPTIGGLYRSQTAFLLHTWNQNTFPTVMGDQSYYETLTDSFPWVTLRESSLPFVTVCPATFTECDDLDFEFITTPESFLTFTSGTSAERIAIQYSKDPLGIDGFLNSGLDIGLGLVSANTGAFMDVDAVRSCDPTYVATSAPVPATTSQPAADSSGISLAEAGTTESPTPDPDPYGKRQSEKTPNAEEEGLDWGVVLGVGIGVTSVVLLGFFARKQYIANRGGTFSSQYRTSIQGRESVRLVFRSKV